LALIGCMLMPIIGVSRPTEVLAAAFVVVGLGAAVVAVVKSRRAHDPYDLDELKSIHEKEELKHLWDSEPEPEGKTVLCRNCDAVYEARLGVCPECGSFSGS
jgi:hypothetical protein